MKSYRERFFEQYTYRTTVMPNGKKRRVMVYHGPLYRWDLSPAKLRAAKSIHVLLPLLSALLLILSSLQPVQANTNRVVAILSMIALAAMLPELWGGLLFMLQRKPEMTALEWHEVHMTVLISSFVHALFLCLSAVLVFIISIRIELNVPVCAGYACAAVCPICMHICHRSIPVQCREAESLENSPPHI